MFRTKPKFADWQTPEQRAFSARQVRRDDAARRDQCNLLMFWSICARPACRRNQTCSGDMHACFRRHWALVPEDEKEWIRGAILAKCNGATGDELGRAADARRADYLKSIEPRSAAAVAPAPALRADGSQVVPPAGVRISRL